MSADDDLALADCHACFDRVSRELGREVFRGMVRCPKCGNKRCPRATHHLHPCSGSNEPGQVGSVYGEHRPIIGAWTCPEPGAFDAAIAELSPAEGAAFEHDAVWWQLETGMERARAEKAEAHAATLGAAYDALLKLRVVDGDSYEALARRCRELEGEVERGKMEFNRMGELYSEATRHEQMLLDEYDALRSAAVALLVALPECGHKEHGVMGPKATHWGPARYGMALGCREHVGGAPVPWADAEARLCELTRGKR